MKVIVKHVGKDLELKDISGTLESLQSIVDGPIELVPIYFEKFPYYLVVNEEGKLIEDSKMNMTWKHNDIIFDYIFGNVLFMHAKENHDLTEEDFERFKRCVIDNTMSTYSFSLK